MSKTFCSNGNTNPQVKGLGGYNSIPLIPHTTPDGVVMVRERSLPGPATDTQAFDDGSLSAEGRDLTGASGSGHLNPFPGWWTTWGG